MPTLEAPTIETFEPIKAYRELGVAYISLRNPDGVQLELSEPGAIEADRNPALAGLLARMGAFIAENDGYRSVTNVKAAEPGDILRVGEHRSETRRLGYGKIRLSSVYRHDSAPSAIVKAYDYDRLSAGFQFYMGAWMHNELAKASDGVKSPAQLGLFSTSRFGHRTTVIDYVEGENLHLLSFKIRNGDQYDAAEAYDAADAARDMVRAKIRNGLGWRGAIVANDLRNVANIMVDDPETATPENLLEREFSVIDQPVIKKHNIALQAAARYLPQINGNLFLGRPKLAPHPTQLSGPAE